MWVIVQSGAASTPPDTFSHSTITVPLNRLGSVGRYTSARVAYGALVSTRVRHRPFSVSGASGANERAVPDTKNSAC